MKNIKSLVTGAIAASSIISLKPAQAQTQMNFNPAGQWMCQQTEQAQGFVSYNQFQLLVHPNQQYQASGMGEVKAQNGQSMQYQSQSQGLWEVNGANVTFAGQSLANFNGEPVQSSFVHQYTGINQNTMAMNLNDVEGVVNTVCQRG